MDQLAGGDGVETPLAAERPAYGGLISVGPVIVAQPGGVFSQGRLGCSGGGGTVRTLGHPALPATSLCFGAA
jgi:hypothetical protein